MTHFFMSSLNQFEKWAKPDLSVNILMFERRLRQNDKRFPKCFKIVFLAVEFCKFWCKVHFQETFVAGATARHGHCIRKWYIKASHLRILESRIQDPVSFWSTFKINLGHKFLLDFKSSRYIFDHIFIYSMYLMWK